MSYKSAVIIQREGRWYVARSVELGVVSQGKSVEEAQKNLQEAVDLYLEGMPQTRRVLGKEAPLVTSIEVG